MQRRKSRPSPYFKRHSANRGTQRNCACCVSGSIAGACDHGTLDAALAPVETKITVKNAKILITSLFSPSSGLSTSFLDWPEDHTDYVFCDN
jgi:hypothetical protein